MNDDIQNVYSPLNTLKQVAENLWIVDGPVIRFGPPWLKMPFPTRMTVIRLGDSNLFIHSPTPLTPDLRLQIDCIGIPRWIVGPNRIHYWWISDWATAFSKAEVYLAPRIREQAGGHITCVGHALSEQSGYPWDAEIATLPIASCYMTEVEFFHHASCTLVLTDLIENFEPHKLGSFIMRGLTRLGGVQDPDGQTPRDIRVTFAKQQLQAAVEKMIAWNPERIVFAHGRWYDTNGTAELRRGFRWLLK